MPFRLIAGVLLFATVASSQAFACKGPTVLAADDFTTPDPIWNAVWGEISPSNGKALVKSQPTMLAMVWYEGDFFPAADACVEVITPNAKDPNIVLGGLMFEPANGGMTSLYVRADGLVGVANHLGDYWLNPISARKFEPVKGGPNVANMIRLVWKPNDETVSTFINDAPFYTFKSAPNRNRKVGLYAQTEGGVVQFGKFRVTTPRQ